jgi:hypothetical protein
MSIKKHTAYKLPSAALVFGLRTLVDCALPKWLPGTLCHAVAVLKTPVLLLLAGLTATAALHVNTALWWPACKYD